MLYKSQKRMLLKVFTYSSDQALPGLQGYGSDVSFVTALTYGKTKD